MITLTNLEKIYRTKEIETVALENVNLTVNKGEFLSIMGPSGCGKSTLLNIIGLLDAPTSGTVEIAGINTINMNDKQLAEFRNQKLGFVFQSFHLINSLNDLTGDRIRADTGSGRTAGRNQTCPERQLYVRGNGSPYPALLQCSVVHHEPALQFQLGKLEYYVGPTG